MPESHWMNYVGIVTGIIGAITGISGAIMGYISYRRSNRIKSLDLRLELRKSINDVHLDLNRLKQRIDDADRSRRELMAARGAFRSGAMEKWGKDVSADKAKIEELFKSAPNAQSTYDTLKTTELESELIAVHKLGGEIKDLLDKYFEAIRSDEEQVRQIREDQRARHAART